MSTTPDPQDPATPSTGGPDVSGTPATPPPAEPGAGTEEPGADVDGRGADPDERGTEPGTGGGAEPDGPRTAAAQADPVAPTYYRPGPSSGYYPQYPQNPYGPGSEGRPPPQFSGVPYAAGPSGPPEGVTYPYGGPFPAGTGPVTGTGPVPRPGTMVTSLVLLLVLAGFFLLFGLLFALAPISPEMIPPNAQLDQALAGSGLTIEQLLSAVRTFGVVLAVLAVVYVGLTVAAFAGRFGALIALTVLTALFDLFWLLGLLSAGSNLIGGVFSLFVIALSAAGIALMFGRPARAWFAARR